MTGFLDLPIIDGHVHVWNVEDSIDRLLAEYASIGVDRLAFASLFYPERDLISQNPLGLWLKHHYPRQAYFFAASEYNPPTRPPDQPDFLPPDDQVDLYADLGADGWKLLSGSPGVYTFCLNGREFEPLYRRLEARRLPLIWHVGDPIEFWDPKTTPSWATTYTDAHPSLERLRNEAIEVVERHPELNVIFAHFFFMGYELERASELMDRCPNVHFDVTPGLEMYFGFSSQRDQAREFFLKYADRIVFGTDSSAGRPARPRVKVIRHFLETDDTFRPRDDNPRIGQRDSIRGIALPREVLEKIYSKNFERLGGERPKPLDETAAFGELERLKSIGPSLRAVRDILDHWNRENGPARVRTDRSSQTARTDVDLGAPSKKRAEENP